MYKGVVMKTLRVFRWGLIAIVLFSYLTGFAVHVMNPGESRAVFKKMEQKLKQSNAVITEQEINTLNAAAKILGRPFAKQYAMLTDQIEDRQDEQRRSKELKEKKEKPFEDKTNLLEKKEIEQQKEDEKKKVEDQIAFEGHVEGDEEVEQRDQKQKKAEQKKIEAQEKQKQQRALEDYYQKLVEAIINVLKVFNKNKVFDDVLLAKLLNDKVIYTDSKNLKQGTPLKDLLKTYLYLGTPYPMTISDKRYENLVKGIIDKSIKYFESKKTTLEDYTNRMKSALGSLVILAEPVTSQEFKNFYNDQVVRLQDMLKKQEEEARTRQITENEKKEDQFALGYGDKITAAVGEKLKNLSITNDTSLKDDLDSFVRIGGVFGLGSASKKISEWLEGYTYKKKRYTFVVNKKYEEIVVSLVSKLDDYIDKIVHTKIIDFNQNILPRLFQEFQILINPTDTTFKKYWETTKENIRRVVDTRIQQEKARVLRLSTQEKEKEEAEKAKKLVAEITSEIKDTLSYDWGHAFHQGSTYGIGNKLSSVDTMIKTLLAAKLSNNQSIEQALDSGLGTNDMSYKKEVDDLYYAMGAFYINTQASLNIEWNQSEIVDNESLTRLQQGFGLTSKLVDKFVTIIIDQDFNQKYKKYKETIDKKLKESKV